MKNLTRDLERYHYDTSTDFAEFLLSKGEQMINIEGKAGEQKTFVFKKNPRLLELLDIYKIGSDDDEEFNVNWRKSKNIRNHLLEIVKR